MISVSGLSISSPWSVPQTAFFTLVATSLVTATLAKLGEYTTGLNWGSSLKATSATGMTTLTACWTNLTWKQTWEDNLFKRPSSLGWSIVRAFKVQETEIKSSRKHFMFSFSFWHFHTEIVYWCYLHCNFHARLENKFIT